ncbi:hypothetical protein PJ311_18185 [Bacillus sp. CLL-7-23]|uniref:Uncharacterized protein n=1 Tax=Bacillus changyiensis TaxID=3004103 RepID=A0ABT4X855_9BACI|nr:hypothetical protein [Bacillus changyiensis]MDA7028470.1 hypothetical protein [Bacillus changyiensis]
MDINKELYDLKVEIDKARSFKNIFWDSPFLDTEKDKREKKEIFIRFFILTVIYIATCLVKILLTFDKVDIGYLIISILLCLVLFVCYLGYEARNFCSLNGHKGYYDLRYTLCYKAFRRRLEKSSFSTNDIEKYILPLLKAKNSTLESYTFKSYLKVVIPSFIAGSIVAFLNQPKIDFSLYLNIIFIVIFGFIVSMIGANSPGYHKGYKLLETLLYNYLLEKDHTSQK